MELNFGFLLFTRDDSRPPHILKSNLVSIHVFFFQDAKLPALFVDGAL